MPVTWNNGEMTITPDPPNPLQDAEEARAAAYRARRRADVPAGTPHPDAAEFYQRMMDGWEPILRKD